ncbi:MAG: hypothetical protein ACTHJ4_08030 [Candidatus Nucleicultricaceae bacterium]
MMKTLALLTIGFSLSMNVVSFAAAPDLSKLSAEKVLRLGINNVERLEGRCYHIQHDFCEVGTDPRNCQENDVAEQKTNAKLDAMTFVLKSRTLNEKKQEVLVYKAAPISSKIKEEDLYVLRGTKQRSPIRFFVTLREASCTVQTPETTEKVTTQPTPKAPSSDNSTLNVTPKQDMEVIAIPPSNNKKDHERALKFLTNIPLKGDARTRN